MLARTVLLLMVVPFWLSMHGQSLAQYRTDLVCWADEKNRCPAPWNADNVKFIACGSGGYSRFNPTWLCEVTCRITLGPTDSGGSCGYQAARIDCFSGP